MDRWTATEGQALGRGIIILEESEVKKNDFEHAT
jgi:hypothetical protein